MSSTGAELQECVILICDVLQWKEVGEGELPGRGTQIKIETNQFIPRDTDPREFKKLQSSVKHVQSLRTCQLVAVCNQLTTQISVPSNLLVSIQMFLYCFNS